MNITDVQSCADYFKEHYLETFYLITTYDLNSFILIGEPGNFPHIVGIERNTYRSNGYARAQNLFQDIINRCSISTRIIPNNISPTSKMYKKVLNFNKSTDIFWKNSGPLAISYDPTRSNTRLNNVDVLLTDLNAGYMLGWVYNDSVSVNGNVSIKKYCICTWIDESTGTTTSREKYMPSQNIELIRDVMAFDTNSKLIKEKHYKYDHATKTMLLRSCERNGSNLIIDSRNVHYYTEIAMSQNIHCKINGTQY